MSAPVPIPLTINRGDDYNYPICVYDVNSDLMNLTGGTLYFTVKDKEKITDSDSDDTTALFQVLVTNFSGLTTVSGFIPVLKANTNLLTRATKWVYDVQYTDVLGNVMTVVPASDITVKLDVTRS